MLNINRGCVPTDFQATVENMVDAADRALPGVTTGLNREVPESVRTAIRDLSRLLAEARCGEATLVRVRPGPTPASMSPHRVPGIRLSRLGATEPAAPLASGKREPYAIALVTHIPWWMLSAAPEERDMYLLNDGFGPPPLMALTGNRFRHAFPGLLGLVAAEAKSLAEGDDYNWGAIDGEGDAHLDEAWHPNEMLRRVREMRAAVLRLVDTVCAVLEA